MSLRSEFRVVISTLKRCWVRLCLKLFVGGAHVLFTLFVFDYVLWCSTHIVFSVLFFFVLCTPCCQFLSIVTVASAINDRFFF